MKAFALAVALSCALVGQALAWGQEGHSIVAEIAQHRLSPQAAALVEQLLGRGHSLASIASWADDVREERPETSGWHFVDIPISVPAYDERRDCKKSETKGDCIVKELERLKDALPCATGDDKVEALKFAVHFIGDIHQPLHTVHELTGANDIKVDVFMRGLTCTGTCEPTHTAGNFHTAWDSDLIKKAVWDWGAYVDRLEGPKGWLNGPDAKREGVDGGTPAAWADDTHQLAPVVWMLRPADNVLDDRYFRDVLPKLDQQLGLAGLRLAKFLNDAAVATCPSR